MLKDLRGLAKESAVYGLSTVLGRMMSFLLTPLFTHLLDRTESGVVQTAYAYIAFLTVVYGLGLDVAYLRLGRENAETSEKAFSSAFTAIAALAIVASIVAHLTAGRLAVFSGLPAGYAEVVRLSAWILALDALALMPYTELRGSHQAGTYAAIKTAGIAINLVLAWVFVRSLHLGVRGIFLANLTASAATLVMLAPVTARRFCGFDATRLKELSRFGLPLVVALLGSMVVQVADRPIMTRLAGLGMAGLYGNCYKLGIFMSLLVGMFDQAWKPFVLERANRAEVDALIARVLTYFAALSSWVLLAITFFVRLVATAPLWHGHSLFHPSFWEGLVIVPVVSLGYLFNGLYFVMLAPLMIDRRMGSVGVATWIGATINVVANLFWIPRWGMMGAAWATCAAYAAMVVCVWVLGRRTRPVPYEWTRLAALAGWTGLLAAAGARSGVPGKILLLAVYPVALGISGFLAPDEVREFRELLRARRRRAPAST